MRKKKNQERGRITIQDYIKAVKKADRESQLETNIGFTTITKVHKSKKLYTRKNNKKDYLEDQ
uniref:hypothetical protein n=1 Tax=uncultured Dysgonomonas sp. TaxID=206096 RepID=UPI0026058637|nr:hypothetical protein [uncultured Dysgonomonas sp.]